MAFKPRFDVSIFTKELDEENKFFDLDEDAYHLTDRLSSGGVKDLLRSPQHFFSKKVCGNVPEATPAMEFGAKVHKIVLEGSKYKDSFAIMPKFSGEGMKARKERWMSDNAGKIVLKEDEHEVIFGIVESISNHPLASKLLSRGKPEQTGFFRMEGINCKCKPDFLRHDGMIVDLKTTIDAREDMFMKSAWSLGYHIQAAFYLHGASIILGKPLNDFVFVAVEKEPPYAVSVYPASEIFIGEGRKRVDIALNRLKKALETNLWPGYNMAARELLPPRYAEYETLEME